MVADEREEAAFSKRLAIQSVVAIAVVAFASLFHAWWGLLACSDDSGGESVCWMYDSSHRGSWETAAIFVLLAPIGAVLVSSGIALWYWRPSILRWTTAVAVAFTVVLLFAGKGIFGAP